MTETKQTKGPFIFYEVGGGGLVGFGGGSCEKKWLLRGGASKKNEGKRGGHVKYFSKTLK